MPPLSRVSHRVTKKHLKPMIRQHEIMLEILTNPALAGTLQGLIDDAPMRKKWIANAQASAVAAGFTFTPTSEVTMAEYDRGWQVEVRVYEDPHTYVFGYDSVKGFYYK